MKVAADQMEDRLLYWVGTASLVGLLAWDDWLVRDELAQLRQERSALVRAAQTEDLLSSDGAIVRLDVERC